MAALFSDVYWYIRIHQTIFKFLSLFYIHKRHNVELKMFLELSLFLGHFDLTTDPSCKGRGCFTLFIATTGGSNPVGPNIISTLALQRHSNLYLT